MKTLFVWLLCCTAAVAQVNQRGNPAGTGEFHVRPLRTEPKIAWEARPGFRDFGSIAASGNTVVTGNINSTGGAFGFDVATGKKLWGIPGMLYGEPAVDERAAYVINYTPGGKKLRSVDLRTGRVLWSVEEEYLGADDAPPLVSGGRLYVTNQCGTLRVYDSATGKPVWQFVFSPTKSQCPTPMALADGTLFFGGSEELMERSNGPMLWAVNAATGKEVWRFKTAPGRDRGNCVSAPAAADGTVVVTSDHTLYALDARTGAIRWKAEGAVMVNGQTKTERLSEPIIVAGTIYCYMDDGLAGWDLATGRRTFEFRAHFDVGNVKRRMAAANGVLYFLADPPGAQGPNDPHMPLLALDLQTRQLLWTHRVNRATLRYAGDQRWTTTYFLPVDGGLYYENQSILVKLE